MSTPTLPWPDLSAYNLLLTVTHDKAGNRALILRPKDPGEAPEKTTARVQTLAPKIDQVCQKIGTEQIRSRILRDQYLVFTGNLVRNQALINKFFGRLFPRSTTVELTLAEAESAEVVRQAAMERQSRVQVGPDTELDLETLAEVLPGGLEIERTDTGVRLTRAEQSPVDLTLDAPITNGQLRPLLADHLNGYFASLNVSDPDLILERLTQVNKTLTAGSGMPYWAQVILETEQDYLNQTMTLLTQAEPEADQTRDEVTQNTDEDNPNTPLDQDNAEGVQDNPDTDKVAQNNDQDNQRGDLSIPELEAIRYALIERLDNQGRVVDARVLERLTQVEGLLRRLRAGTEGGQVERDNVQEGGLENEGAGAGTATEETPFDANGYRAIGQNTEGEALYEDRRGIRSRIEGDFRISEKVRMVPGNAGVSAQPAERNESWLTVDEALDRAPAQSLTYEDMVRGAFITRATADDAHQFKAIAFHHNDTHRRLLIRSRERGNLHGELELITLADTNGQYTATAERLTGANERQLGGLPYPAPMVMIDLWEDAGFHVPENAVQNSLESPQSDQKRANLENRQLNNEANDATDQREPDPSDAGDEPDGGNVPADLGGTDRVPEQPGAGPGSPGPTTDDLLEQREQSGAVGQPDDQQRNEPELQGGQSRPEGAGAVGGASMDAQGTAGNGTGSGGSLGTGSGSTGQGADNPGTGLQDPAQTVSGQPGADRNDRAVSGRNDTPDAGGVPESGSGDLLGTGPDTPERTDESNGAPANTGSAEPDAAARNPDDSGAAAGGSVGEPVPDASGSESGTSVDLSADPDSSRRTGEDASLGDDGEPSAESLADSNAFDDFDGPERFYAPSDEDTRSPTERLKANLAAIMRLRELEKAGDAPSLEDREVLAGYSGFGGIHAKLFEDYAWNCPEWVKTATRQLKELTRDHTLSYQEYESLRSTILNAHYTHSGIIQPMWEALDRFNVPLDRTLEPSSGILNFKAFMPKALESKVKNITAVEIDPLTARLAQAIHPDATVINSGLEKTRFPDNFFDCAISNVPFGNYNVFDPENPQRKHSIHNTFFLKGLDKVRPGGVIAFVTSAYVLDSTETKVRQEIMERAHVVGAVRLPTGTFERSTGTEVVTDILFLQKKGNFEPNYEPLNILETRTIEAPLGAASPVEIFDTIYEPGDLVPHQKINQVYVDHPEFVLGELCVMTSQHGAALRVTGGGTIPEQRERLRQALQTLPENLPSPTRDTITPEQIAQATAKANDGTRDLSALPGALKLQGTKILVNTLDSQGNLVEKPWAPPKSATKRVLATIQAMTSVADLMALESVAKSDEQVTELTRLRAQASKDADALIKLSNGKKPIAGAALKVLADDARFKLLQGAILVDENNQWTKADIYEKRTVQPMTDAPTKAESLSDAMAIALAYTATISESYMARLLSHTENAPTAEQIRQQLVEQDKAFIDPATDQLVERSAYLSGNLRPKIDLVENIIQSDPSYQKNLDALKDALPPPLKPSEIKVSLDAFWLPEEVIRDFLDEALDVTTSGQFGVKPYFDTFKRHWRLEPSATTSPPSMRRIAEQQEHVAQSRWGTKRKSVFDLLDNAFTNTIPKVLDPIPGTDPTRYQTNAQETLKAQGKHEEIMDAFNRWIFKSPARAQRLADIYNERFNTWVLNDPDGSHMVYPGMAEGWVPRKHQSDFIWRAVSGKNAMTAHVVGAGKTMQLIGTAIRGKQMGRWNKPLVVVPNHMLEQFTNDGYEIYPGARILAMSATDARANNRAAFAARCAMGDWDMVVCTHSVFEKITVPQEFEAKIIRNELAKLRAAMADDESKQYKPKEIETAIKRLEERLERTMDNINKSQENILNLGQIGIDFIGVDEAHYFKNLMVDSSQQIPGVSNASSKRAMNMLIKCQYMHEIHDGPYGIMMATGTPISNSVTECYTFMRMLRPDLLDSMEIRNFNDWMGLFGEIKHGMEIKPEGGGYQMKSRLSRFKNIPELVKTVRTFIDFKTREDLKLPTPKVVTQQIAAPQSPMLKLFMKYIEARAREVRAGEEGGHSPAEAIARELRAALNHANDKTVIDNDTGEIDPDAIEEPAQDILLTIATDGRKASLDMRLIHPKFEDFEDSKVNQCVRKCLELHAQFAEQKATQLIFCDFSSPTGKGIFNVYDDIKAKLIKGGVPEAEIAFIHDAKSDADKETLFTKVRSGEVRFLLGSTQKMGVGTNVQERLVALHQLDPPWKPADVEQRLGRMDRQGNSFKEVYNFIWNTEDSFDLFMWETLDRKLKMIQQAMRRPEDCAREINEETEVGYEDILAITTGNPLIKDFLETRLDLDKYKRMSDSHTDQQADLAGRIHAQEQKVKTMEARLDVLKEEQNLVNQNLPLHILFDSPEPGLRDGPMCTAGGLDGLTDAIRHIAERAPAYRTITAGTFGGLPIKVSRLASEPMLMLQRHDGHDEKVHLFVSQQEMFAQKQDAALGQGTPKKSEDDNRDAAKALVRMVHKIAKDNGIPRQEEALEVARRNLDNLRADLGKPFEYETEYQATRERFDTLAAELGDTMDNEKAMDPVPLVEMADLIHKQTGDYGHLPQMAEALASNSARDQILNHLRTVEDQMDMEEDDDPDDGTTIDLA